MNKSASSVPALTDGWIDSVKDYHRVAYAIVGQARYSAVERFALTSTNGGFGTPLFAPGGDAGAAGKTGAGSERCVCVVGDQLCVATDTGAGTDCCAAGNAGCEQITTLRAAAVFAGLDQPGTDAAEHDSPELGNIDRKLNVSQQVGETLGWWYALGAEVLNELVSTPGAIDPDEVVLWPGHFDIATAIGASAGRASYGLSPGDHSHPEPYVYVGPWAEVDINDDYWNDEHFTGASLPYQALAGVIDPTAMVREFLRTGYDKLNQSA